MRKMFSITLAAAAVVQLVGCSDAPTRPSEAGPSKAFIIGGPIIVPQPILNPNDYVAITAGGSHTCVQRRSGNVYCWGADDYGQSPAASPSTCPSGPCVKVPTFVAVAKQVSAGYQHTCLLSSAGTAWCTGGNGYGELGLGYYSPNGSSSGQVLGLTFSAIGAGTYATCGLASTGVYCWGLIQAGLNSASPGIGYDTAQQITSYVGYTSVSVGYEDACFHMGTPPWSETDCYGSNAYGKLAQDPTQWPTTRGIILGTGLGNSTTGVSVADNYTCATQASGVVQCFGLGYYGELGNGQPGVFWQPQTVGNGQQLRGVTTGTQHACALDPNNAAYCWGMGYHGEVGNNASGWWATPQLVVGGHTFYAIAAGYRHTCGIGTDQHIWCWGDNSFGQMGVSYLIGGWWPSPVQAADPT